MSVAIFVAFIFLLFKTVKSIIRLLKLKLKRKKNQIKREIKIARDKKAKEER